MVSAAWGVGGVEEGYARIGWCDIWGRRIMRPRWGRGISTVMFMGLFNGEIHGAFAGQSVVTSCLAGRSTHGQTHASLC